jgi:hypothetical protein
MQRRKETPRPSQVQAASNSGDHQHTEFPRLSSYISGIMSGIEYKGLAVRLTDQQWFSRYTLRLLGHFVFTSYQL